MNSLRIDSVISESVVGASPADERFQVQPSEGLQLIAAFVHWPDEFVPGSE